MRKFLPKFKLWVNPEWYDRIFRIWAPSREHLWKHYSVLTSMKSRDFSSCWQLPTWIMGLEIAQKSFEKAYRGGWWGVSSISTLTTNISNYLIPALWWCLIRTSPDPSRQNLSTRFALINLGAYYIFFQVGEQEQRWSLSIGAPLNIELLPSEAET